MRFRAACRGDQCSPCRHPRDARTATTARRRVHDRQSPRRPHHRYRTDCEVAGQPRCAVRNRRGPRLMATCAVERDSFESGYRRLAGLVRDVVAEQAVASVLPCVVATLRELVRCEDIVIWETVGNDELAVALVDGDDEEQMRGMRIRFGEGLTGLAALEQRAAVSNSAHVDARAGLVPGTKPTPEAVACMPLIARDRLLGVLSIYRAGAGQQF